MIPVLRFLDIKPNEELETEVLALQLIKNFTFVDGNGIRSLRLREGNLGYRQ